MATKLGIVSEVTRVEAKALSPIVVIEFPRVSEVSGASKKAVAPIVITESGIVTDLRGPDKSERKEKAPAPIEITDPSITSVPSHNVPLEALKVEVETEYVSPVQAISTEPFALALGMNKRLVKKESRSDATMEVCKRETNLIKLSPETSLNS